MREHFFSPFHQQARYRWALCARFSPAAVGFAENRAWCHCRPRHGTFNRRWDRECQRLKLYSSMEDYRKACTLCGGRRETEGNSGKSLEAMTTWSIWRVFRDFTWRVVLKTEKLEAGIGAFQELFFRFATSDFPSGLHKPLNITCISLCKELCMENINITSIYEKNQQQEPSVRHVN